jgi:hypothetical protein
MRVVAAQEGKETLDAEEATQARADHWKAAGCRRHAGDGEDDRPSVPGLAREIPLVILGNPFHLTSENLGRLKDLGVTSFQLSLDGLESTHDMLRKPGSFQATLAAIRLVNESGLRSMVMSTVSLLNYHDMPDVVRLCVTHEVGNCRRFTSPVGNIRDKSFRELFFSPAMDRYRNVEPKRAKPVLCA